MPNDRKESNIVTLSWCPEPDRECDMTQDAGESELLNRRANAPRMPGTVTPIFCGRIKDGNSSAGCATDPMSGCSNTNVEAPDLTLRAGGRRVSLALLCPIEH
jgi:hypothetical protein